MNILPTDLVELFEITSVQLLTIYKLWLLISMTKTLFHFEIVMVNSILFISNLLTAPKVSQARHMSQPTELKT